MRHSTRKVTRGSGRPARGGRCVEYDPHEAIDLELLHLWIGLSRLREQFCSQPRRRPRGGPTGTM